MNPRLYDIYDGLDAAHFRARNMLGYATVRLVDDTGATQQLQTEGYTTEIRSQVQRIGHLGVGSVPLPGAMVVMLHLGGHRGQKTAVAIEDPRYRPRDGAPGETIVYAIDGAGSDGSGGQVWTIIHGKAGKAIEMDGVTFAIGKNGTTTTVDIYGSTGVNVHTPHCVITNGGTPSPVMTEAGLSTVLAADA